MRAVRTGFPVVTCRPAGGIGTRNMGATRPSHRRPDATTAPARGIHGAGAVGWRGGSVYFLVSQKIVEISSILSSSCCATATSVEPFVPPAPASFVASLKSWCSFG